eukprot:TRINITY_DN16133_c0_g1_i1.p1 TRINITY_DN16133_c0_g1~~TRINITY_DN16133_c0_g1_i1.p1  ORF type:complete len:243 (+),score=56.63 TRINITY_DN16133_c0_g1_i1:45-773(+)
MEDRDAFFEQLHKDRLRELHELFSCYSPVIAREILPHDVHPKMSDHSRLDKAAIEIQKVVRGYIARRKYTMMLYKHYVKIEQDQQLIIRQQVEEGLFMLERQRLEDEVDRWHQRQIRRSIEESYAAFIIQRWWRSFRSRYFASQVANRLATIQNVHSIPAYSADAKVASTPTPVSVEDLLVDDLESGMDTETLELYNDMLVQALKDQSDALSICLEKNSQLIEENAILDKLVRNIISKIVKS